MVQVVGAAHVAVHVPHAQRKALLRQPWQLGQQSPPPCPLPGHLPRSWPPCACMPSQVCSAASACSCSGELCLRAELV